MDQEQEQSKWNLMAKSRQRFSVALAAVTTIGMVIQLAMTQKFSQQFFPYLILLAPALFARVRDHLPTVTIILFFFHVWFIVACISTMKYMLTKNTFFYSLDLEKNSEEETALTCCIRVVTMPLILAIGTSRIGLPRRWTLVTNVITVFFGCACAATISNFLTGIRGQEIRIVFWVLTTSIFIIWVVIDNERLLNDVQRLSQQAKTTAATQLEQQIIASTNQQRIVGYIFHEVRNPINSVLLASELTLDILRPHTQTPKNFSPRSTKTAISQTPITTTATTTTTKTTPTTPTTRTTECSTEFTTLENSNHSFTDLPTTSILAVPPISILSEVREMIEDIRQSTEAAVRVLNDALNLQKLQSGAFEFSFAPFAPEDLISATVRIVHSQMVLKQIEFSSFLDPSLEGVRLVGDFYRLRQVLLNYLTNAYKFTPTGGQIQIRVVRAMICGDEANQSDGMDSIVVRVSVFNTGNGISPADRAKIFQPWSQLRSGKQQQEGSGLGLALCKAFVEQGHCGRVWFESSAEEGTEFFFEICFQVEEPQSAPSSPNHDMFQRQDTVCDSPGLEGTSDFLSQTSSPRLCENESGQQTNSHNSDDVLVVQQNHHALHQTNHSHQTKHVSVPVSQFELSLVRRITPTPSPMSSAKSSSARTDDSQELGSSPRTLKPTTATTTRMPSPSHSATTSSLAPAVPSLVLSQSKTPSSSRSPSPNPFVPSVSSAVLSTASSSAVLSTASSSAVLSTASSSDTPTKCTVLVVEDSALSRKLLVRLLTGLNIHVEQAVDGQEAVDKVAANGVEYYKVILMDKEMPRLDGFDATKRIRQMGFTGGIIGCTGNVLEDQVKDFLDVGADHVIGKPLSQDGVVAALRAFGACP